MILYPICTGLFSGQPKIENHENRKNVDVFNVDIFKLRLENTSKQKGCRGRVFENRLLWSCGRANDPQLKDQEFNSPQVI